MCLSARHVQARRAIERLIVDRGIKAGSRIPSESKLAAELYVSRTITVAIDGGAAREIAEAQGESHTL